MNSNTTKIYMLNVYADAGDENIFASSTFYGFKREIAENIASGKMIYEPYRDKDSETQAEEFLHDFDTCNWSSFGTDLSFANETIGDIWLCSVDDSGNTVRNVNPNQVLLTLYFTTEEFDELLKTVFGDGVRGSYSAYGMNIEDDADELTTWEFYHDLAKYLNISEITSIHNDHSEMMGVWVAYR